MYVPGETLIVSFAIAIRDADLIDAYAKSKVNPSLLSLPFFVT